MGPPSNSFRTSASRKHGVRVAKTNGLTLASVNWRRISFIFPRLSVLHFLPVHTRRDIMTLLECDNAGKALAARVVFYERDVRLRRSGRKSVEKSRACRRARDGQGENREKWRVVFLRSRMRKTVVELHSSSPSSAVRFDRPIQTSVSGDEVSGLRRYAPKCTPLLSK